MVVSEGRQRGWGRMKISVVWEGFEGTCAVSEGRQRGWG